MVSAAASPALENRLQSCSSWPERFTREQWAIYKSVMAAAREHGIPFAIGGALSAMTYAGSWRDTKDIDLYILKRDRGQLIRVLADLGLQDYYEQLPYDRNWIYRSYKNGIIVDIMWAMANQRAAVTETWLRGPEIEVDGVRFRLLPPEEAIWSKLYVMQRDRCDWPDIFNIVRGLSGDLDWQRLMSKLNGDVRLFGGVLSAYGWLCPDEARKIPASVWEQAGVSPPAEQGGAETTAERSRLLDSRAWLGVPAGERRG